MTFIRGLCASLRGVLATRRFGKPEEHRSRRAGTAGLLAMVPIMLAGQAQAEVALRVEARPLGDPIRAHVTVTNAEGNPVGGLNTADFTVAVDGTNIATPPVQQPPVNGESGQHVSVVFAMDYSHSVQTVARAAMEQAVKEFIGSMAVGDYAAIVKFNGKNGAAVVQPFTAIDATNTALLAAVPTDYPGSGTNIFDAVVKATAQFTSPPVPLPAGPKAIILVSDGAENQSTADINEAVRDANDAGIAIFTIGVGDFTRPNAQSMLTALADQTGGDFYPAPTASEVGKAYVEISQLLNNEYLLSFASSISDCAEHALSVTVAGQAAPANAKFTRCRPVMVPQVEGKTEAEATRSLTDYGLNSHVAARNHDASVAAGLVITQSPNAGTAVSPNSTVDITVSLGPAPAPPSSGGGGGGGGGASGPFMVLGLMLLGLVRNLRRRA